MQDFTAVRFIGKEVTVGRKGTAADLWKQVLSDGTNDFLQSLEDRVSPLGDTVGWMGEYNPKTKEYTYIVGIFARPGASVPAGLSYRDIPDCMMGNGWIQGNTPNLEKGAHVKTEKIMRANGYEPDYSKAAISMEYYSYKKIAAIQEDGTNVFTFGYYLPCKKSEKCE